MNITRIYRDQNGDSHFQEVRIALSNHGDIGSLSGKHAVKALQFRMVPADYDYNFHCAPQRQYLVLLDGGVEIGTSLGDIRQFPTGNVLLLEDVTGKGHKSKNLENRERTSLFIHLDDSI